MSEEVYRALAKHLDQLPGGYPPTESGVELRILRRLFCEEHAKLAVYLRMVPDSAEKIAKRAGIPGETCVRLLQEMEREGLIFSVERRGEIHYLAAQFVVGIWEYHVNSLDAQLIRDVNEYLPALMRGNTWKDAPQLRTIPVERSLSVEHHALPYEHAEELIDGKRKYLVAPCICRREHELVGEGCGKPEEACLLFDTAAEFYERRGVGRVIDKEETLRILQLAEQHGLVVQPSNAQNPLSICLCCGCCCQVLRMLKRQPRPAASFTSPFTVQLDPEQCSGCGVCLDRCPMDALRLVRDKADPVEGRCIGCGLCVSTCPDGALTLRRSDKQPRVPKDARTALVNLAKVRIKMSSGFSERRENR